MQTSTIPILPRMPEGGGMDTTLRRFALFIAVFFSWACSSAQTTHGVVPASASQLAGGTAEATSPAASWSQFMSQLDEAGPIDLQKHVAADWVIPRSGLINLDHPTAEAARLRDEPEAIQIYFYVLEHPKYGGYLIDSGVASAFRNKKDAPLRFPLKSFVPFDELYIRLDMKSYLAQRTTPVRGVLLTHLHLDHIMGLSDIPKDVPLYVGPGEAEDSRFTHLFARPTTNLNLAGFGPLRELRVRKETEAPFSYVDLFGDSSALALHAPGHTDGNMAFLLRTTQGPVLIAGDCSHTAWGWEHSVEPGTFNTSMEQAASSLDRLKAFAQANPTVRVHLGHQPLAHQQDRSVEQIAQRVD